MSCRLVNAGFQFVDGKIVPNLNNRAQHSRLKLISDAVLGRKYHLTISEYSNTHLNWSESDTITSSQSIA